jgi:serine/threonine protein kinase
MSATLAAGTLLHNQGYEIVKQLGQGSFGVVYQARDRQAAADALFVALKQLPMQMIVNCERQADVRAMLNHPTIPRILGYFVDGDHAYLVQQYIDGTNLEEILNAEIGFLPEQKVINWGIQLCDALGYLHSHAHYPMIFRDLKPNNIMADKAGQIYLVDFGLARVFPPRYFEERPAEFQQYRQGLDIGTEGYSPPEQYEGILEPQSDIYALGATMHHLLTRRDPRREPPFTFHEHPVRSINPAVSLKLEAIVMQAVTPNIPDRFQSAMAMQTALLKAGGE